MSDKSVSITVTNNLPTAEEASQRLIVNNLPTAEEAAERLRTVLLSAELKEAMFRLGEVMQKIAQETYKAWLNFGRYLDAERMEQIARKVKRRELYLRRYRRRGMRMNKR